MDDSRLPSGDPWPPALAGALQAWPAPGWDSSPVLYFDQTGSTNDVAASLAASGAPDGAAAVARSQTAGRGRRGRTWESPAGAGLYFSVVIRPPAASVAAPAGVPAPPAMLITLAAAVAVADAIAAVTGFAPAIKWPNDLVADRGRDASGTWHRRKLAGILAEGAVSGEALLHVVLGVGINLTPAAYPPDVAELATSLEAETGRPVDGFALFAACRAALARDVASLFAGGAGPLLDRWRRQSPSSCGAPVSWQHGGRRVDGVTAGVGDDGALRVRAADGEVLTIVSGEVEWA